MSEKILYFDCFSGISGDMTMAALVELGVPEDYLKEELKKINLSGYHLHFKKDQRKGIFGLRADVHLHDDHHNHHDHDHHDHDHHDHDHHHDHVHRTFDDIKKLFESSGLSEKVNSTSLKIFRLIAEAEGKIHNKPADEVHFHEVGAVDSIVDIAAAAICLDYLNPDRIICSPLELGGGTVKCAHGVFPVPAPAALEILKGIPVKTGAVPFETTTPTGAAIMAACADEFTSSPAFQPEKIAYGVGHRDTEIPNVLRVMIARKTPENKEKDAVLLECNIDDMNPEFYEPLIEKSLKAGAYDTFLTPIIMKKGPSCGKDIHSFSGE